MEQRYKKEFLLSASKLDNTINYDGKIIKLSANVAESLETKDILSLVKIIALILESKEYSEATIDIAIEFKNSLIQFLGYSRIQELYAQSIPQEDNKTLSELQNELNSLIGLDEVKKQVNNLIVFQHVQKLREAQDLHSIKGTMHLAFTGNPGTGKTTVARIVGRMYKQIGLLSKGHFTEVSRTDLIAGYQGQTAIKVKKVIEKARGGVLFIDEAYSITENDHSDSYGRECLTELTKALEDYRDDLVVIVAGYTNLMREKY